MRLRLPTRNFYPRPPRGGRHDLRAGQGPRSEISIHALREEGDRIRHGPAGREVYFYPRPPRGGRRLRPAPEHACGLISIHALREEGDAHKTVKENRKAYFYPRPPRGGRLTREYYYSGREQFLSTPSARRATGAYPRRGAQTSDFYPRPPRGGRPLSFAISPYSADFYPRPPRGGRPATALASRRTQRFLSTPSARRATLTVLPVSTGEKRFLSTPSARRATVLRQPTKEPSPISIHALREEGDAVVVLQHAGFHHISIHALREEGDFLYWRFDHLMHNFYPRPPRGGRRIAVCRMGIPRKISIHALREEGDRFRVCLLPQFRISIHALREEGDIWKALCWSRPILISIHALREEGDFADCEGELLQDEFLSTPSARRATAATA